MACTKHKKLCIHCNIALNLMVILRCNMCAACAGVDALRLRCAALAELLKLLMQHHSVNSSTSATSQLLMQAVEELLSVGELHCNAAYSSSNSSKSRTAYVHGSSVHSSKVLYCTFLQACESDNK
jgi:hypothetical protein